MGLLLKCLSDTLSSTFEGYFFFPSFHICCSPSVTHILKGTITFRNPRSSRKWSMEWKSLKDLEDLKPLPRFKIYFWIIVFPSAITERIYCLCTALWPNLYIFPCIPVNNLFQRNLEMSWNVLLNFFFQMVHNSWQ